MNMEQNVVVRKKPKNVKRTLFIIGMLSVPILQFLVFFIYVNFNTILMSFQVRGQTVTWGFGNYVRFFKEIQAKAEIGYAIRNSLLFGLNDLFLLLISVIFSFFFYSSSMTKGTPEISTVKLHLLYANIINFQEIGKNIKRYLK